jgi:hypothetical protein
MKTTFLLFLTMSWAAWTPGTGFAVPSSPASRPTSPASSANTASGHPGDAGQAASPRDARHLTGGKAPDNQRNHDRASYPNHPPSRASLTRTNRPNSLANNRQRSIPGNALHQPGSDKSRSAVKGGFIPNETVHHAMPVRRSSTVQPSALRGDNMSYRRVNPARVDGGSVPQTRGSSGYPQSHVSRKP